MLPDASKNSVVHCDICQDQMVAVGPTDAYANKPARAYACYPCNNLIYESDLWRYDTQVRRPANAASGD